MRKSSQFTSPPDHGAQGSRAHFWPHRTNTMYSYIGAVNLARASRPRTHPADQASSAQASYFCQLTPVHPALSPTGIKACCLIAERGNVHGSLRYGSCRREHLAPEAGPPSPPRKMVGMVTQLSLITCAPLSAADDCMLTWSPAVQLRRACVPLQAAYLALKSTSQCVGADVHSNATLSNSSLLFPTVQKGPMSLARCGFLAVPLVSRWCPRAPASQSHLRMSRPSQLTARCRQLSSRYLVQR